MAQKLRTDWILFTTVVLMVLYGALMIYSASSVVADIRMGSSYYFALRQLIWIAIAIPLLMFMKRLNYRKLQTPAVAFTAMSVVMILLAAGLLRRSEAAPLDSLRPVRRPAAFRIRQTRAGLVSRLFHRAAFARHQQPLHAAARISRPRICNHGRRRGGSRHRDRPGRNRGCGVLRGRTGNAATS